MAKAQPLSRIDEVCAYGKRQHVSWFSKVSASDREELEEIKRRVKSGECKKPIYTLGRDIVRLFNLNVQPQAVCRWLRD